MCSVGLIGLGSRVIRPGGPPYTTQVYFIFAWPGIMMKFCKNLTGPCGAPTYLPTYLPYLWETKKEIMGRVKVGYYTN